MKNLRIYGNAPYHVAVIHGGPGAPGEVAPVARELSKKFGVLEPFQSEDSIDGQIQELKTFIENHGKFPITLIGYSWGAWLSYMFAAKYPTLMKKLILVGSGAYKEEYVSQMNQIRTNRLTDEENLRVNKLIEYMFDPDFKNKKEVLGEFGKLMSKADSYNPISYEDETIDFQLDIFKNIMKEVNCLRRSGELLEMGNKIECPVVAIHGDYDPHPYEGVEKPLKQVIKNFRFILLKNCGHSPWNESHARDEFCKILANELS